MSRQAPYIPLGITHQGRLTERELDSRIAEKLEPTQGASCCSEFLEDDQSQSADREVLAFLGRLAGRMLIFSVLLMTCLLAAGAINSAVSKLVAI